MMPRLSILPLLLLVVWVVSLPAHADLLDEIRSRGHLVAGVKTDYPPFGFVGDDGQLQGYDVDVARAIAEHLGVSLEVKGVSSSNRMQKLASGEVDLLVATLGDTPPAPRVGDDGRTSVLR